ncbi:xyloside xylosyltransferase 1 isoform X1 [Hippocampus comes]|uniref:Xyloside xylosyltransferase 1 n=1 Tax=Hippocampus comes TaxID=109280 RepID=A0A3Q2Y9E1_HIPCM|nr:PREDICTED: xyloside xylosyltransferase 1 isoform X1 [Hippocampus comes]
MRILRLVYVIMARVSMFRSLQFLLILACVLAVVTFYYFGSENQNFSSTTKRIKLSQASRNTNRNDADLTIDTRFSELARSKEKKMGENDAFQSRNNGNETSVQRYNVLMMFTKVDKSQNLQDKFRVAMLSMVKYAQFLEGEVLVLHFVSDPVSKVLGEKMLQEFFKNVTFKYEVLFHDVDTFTHRLFPIVEALQKHFSAGSWSYFSDAIFFLSVAMHRILPQNLTRIVQLDIDLKYRTNIRDLFQEFDRFPPGAVLGIVREMQPVYRHTFWQYRKENPQTRVGDPPPEGLPGFNSGVMLLDLGAMRASALYNQLLDTTNVTKLADKYSIRGHLGDQDFFTMISMEHPELFYSLACGWNRQLCTWWRDHGYRDVFDLYYRCDGPIYIYHGNCNSPIPDD